MGQSLTLAVGGLMTGPNALRAPSGALLEAENVMCVRPDLLEYRPGFKRDASCELNITDAFPAALFPFDGDLLVYTNDGNGGNARFDWADSEVNVGGTATRPLYDFSPPRAVAARKNLYFVTQTGTYKVCAAGDSEGLPAGLIRPQVRSASDVSGGAVVVPANNSYSHRFCIRRVDANELVVRSPPTVAYARTNSSGSTVDPTFTIWCGQAVAGDVIEVYRTRTRVGNSAAVRRAIGAEYWLAQEYSITAADEAAGYATIRDTCLDADLGAALYTNPSREGELKANDMPPTAADVALWKNCVWWANCRPSQKITRTLVDVGRTDDGLTYAAKTGLTVTNGSAVITGFADTDDIHVGMAYSDAANTPTVSAHFSAGARVVSKTSTTVTMSEAAAGGATPVTRYFYDVVRVAMGASSYFPTNLTISAFAAGTTGVTSGAYRFAATASNERSTARELAYTINALAVLEATTGLTASSFSEDAFTVPPGTLLLEEIGIGLMFPTLKNIEFACTAPAAFAVQPAWPAYYSLTDATWEERNVLRYSKPDQPEHVPSSNLLRVGAANFHTLRIVPLESSLIVFREDGIFRVTGDAPDGWAVTPLDAQTRLLSASAVDAMGNRAYAWTDRGMVAVSENGVSPLSEPVVGMGDGADELKVLRQLFTRGNTIRGCFVVCWPTRGLVCLATPPDSSTGYSSRWWTYAQVTSTWSRFLLGSRCAAFDPDRNAMFRESGLASFCEIRKERTGFSAEESCDDTHEFVVEATPDASTITFTDGNADRWVPAVGDIVYQNVNAPARVATVEYDAGEWTITTEDPHGFADDETATAIEVIEAVIAWAPVFAESPKQRMLLSEAAFAFQEVSADAAWTAVFGAKTDREATAAETEISVSGGESDNTTVWARCWPARAIGRCSHLYPRLRIRDRVRWHLSMLALEIRGGQAGRVKR